MEKKNLGCLKIFKVHDKRDMDQSDVEFNEMILVAENRKSVIDTIFEKFRTDEWADQLPSSLEVIRVSDVDRHFQIDEVGNICDLKSGDEISSCNYSFDY
jgi:hypothetical protein